MKDVEMIEKREEKQQKMRMKKKKKIRRKQKKRARRNKKIRENTLYYEYLVELNLCVLDTYVY